MVQTKQMEGNIASLIRSFHPSLTKSEQKVADTVLRDLDSVLYYSVTDLADHAEVGETTALRFCRKIGFRGYQEFKLAIAKTVSSHHYHADKGTKPQGMSESIAQYTKEAIEETFQMIDKKVLEKCLHKINKANSLYFFGVGTSGLTALDAKSRLIRMGVQSDALIDPHMQAMVAATLGKEDVVIGISVSGSTKDTLDSLAIAKKNKATIIAITYYARSPITNLADYVLLSGGKESPLEGGSLSAKICQLYVIDLLCTGLALKNKEKALKMKELTAQSVVDKIY